MGEDWKDVELLIRGLGAIVSAAQAARLGPAEKESIKTALAEATEAVGRTIDDCSAARRLRARINLDTAEEVLACFDEEAAVARQLHAASAPLNERARELVAQVKGMPLPPSRRTDGPKPS